MDPSAADSGLASAANAAGALVKGKPLTARQIQDWRFRDVIGLDTRVFPGRPSGGSSSRYPDGALATVVGLAAALDESPRSFPRAVLVAFSRGIDIADRGLKAAYRETHCKSLFAFDRTRRSGGRLRISKGVFDSPMDSLVRGTLFTLMFDEVPLDEGIAALIDHVGLPAEIITEPSDPEIADIPEVTDLVREIAYARLTSRAMRASQAELRRACATLQTLHRYVTLLGRYVEATESRGDINYVFTTLVVGGQRLARLDAVGGSGATDYRAALFAPLFLSVEELMPRAARSVFEQAMATARWEIPRLEAMLSLVEEVEPRLRCYLGIDLVLRINAADDQTRQALHDQATTWSNTHPEFATLLRTEPETQCEPQ